MKKEGRREKGEGRREKGEGRREKGEGRREKGEGRREKGEGRRVTESREQRRCATSGRFPQLLCFLRFFSIAQRLFNRP